MEETKEQKEPEKVCKKCGILKPMGKYSKATANTDGHKGTCKACDAKRFQEFQAEKKKQAAAFIADRPPSAVKRPTKIKAPGHPERGSEIRRRRVSKDVEPASQAEALANAHWSYVSALLARHGSFEDGELETIEFHYKTAFEHGFGHGHEAGSASGR